MDDWPFFLIVILANTLFKLSTNIIPLKHSLEKRLFIFAGIQLDIVGGAIPSVGRVQITYDGVPGSLCTEEWSHNDAFLVSRRYTHQKFAGAMSELQITCIK